MAKGIRLLNKCTKCGEEDSLKLATSVEGQVDLNDLFSGEVVFCQFFCKKCEAWISFKEILIEEGE